MKKGLLILFTLCTVLSVHASGFQYVSPKPDAIMVSAQTNIIFRHSDYINSSKVSDNLISVIGSKSGIHEGEFILSDDAQTILFNPYNTFADNEVVTVQLREGLKTLSDSEINAYSFSFTTAPAEIVQISAAAFVDDISLAEIPAAHIPGENEVVRDLPAPPITINSIDNPSPGYIFMATWDRNVPHLFGNFIFVLDSNGAIVDSVRIEGAPFDFQIQPNGLLSYAMGDFSGNVPGPGEELRHMVLDDNFAVVDSFKMKNGYETDFHEFLLLPNGHAMMMSYHTIIYDMSTIVEGGRPDASLVINIIQEQDLNKNVVFEWRNIDYIPITESDLDLTAPRINYGTINAFKVDDDGNILVSFRNHSEIMKISRATGEVMWRMGSPRGEYTFIGEHEENAPYYFARQHNIVRLPNGNISIFDNGQFHTPPYSRAVEYSIDEVDKVATMVSEWRYPDGNIFCATAGNAQQLPNGGWFIGYGAPHPQQVVRNAVEVHPDGSIALELTLPGNVLAYRAYKFPWMELVHRPSFTHFEVLEGNTYSFNDESNITGVEITYLSLTGAYYNQVTVTRHPYGPVDPEFFGGLPTIYPTSIIYEGAAIESHTSEIHIDLEVFPEIGEPATTSIYWREFPNSGLFLQMPTTYDSLNNELITTITAFGELVFGNTSYEYSANPPILYEPLNQIRLLPADSLALRWTGQGYADAFRVQLSTDSLFSTTLVDSTLNSSFIFINQLMNYTTYYWRVRAILETEESDWSSVWSFETTDPFITIISPNGGEEWILGSTEVIRWETNISDTVSIDLLFEQQNMLIGSAPGYIKAFAWQIPSDLTAASGYRIEIRSIIDNELFAVSEESFSLVDSVNSIENVFPGIASDDFILHQNFPNPFNPVTTIAYELPHNSMVELNIYNITGEKVRTLLNDFQTAGSHQIEFNASNLSSGVYISEIKAGDVIQRKKLLLLK